MFIKTLIRIIVLAALWQSVQAAPDAPDSKTMRSIKTELEQMRKADQAVRRNLNYLDSEQVEKMRTVDAVNRKRLKEIITLIGWPSKELVGEDASRGAFLVAQHAPDDLDFMKEVFSYIEADYRKQKASPSQYALMYDRIKMLEGKPQRFGTQFNINASGCRPWKMEEPQKVDEYRAQMGLDNLAVYAKKVCGR
ncbi:MAG: DUF6624 domain-containing protein [Telluria sp.]